MINVLTHMSDIMIPMVIFWIVGYGMVSGVKVYETFLKGAKEGLRIVVEKGSIAIDGVSLTVARVGERSFSVSLIPHTQGVTTLHERRVGDRVNLENDMLVKYVEKLMGRAPQGGLTLDFLRENGF